VEIKEDKKIAFQPLETKIQKSIEVVLEAEKRFGKEDIAVAWTGSRDSAALLFIIKTAYKGSIPFRVVTLDSAGQSADFYEFRDKLSRDWNLQLIVLKDEADKPPAPAGDQALQSLRAQALEDGVKGYGIKALFTGIRWDEHPVLSGEKYFSEREGHVRVNPLLHFMGKDVRSYIESNNVPYFDPGETATQRDSASEGPGGDKAADKEKILENLRELGYF